MGMTALLHVVTEMRSLIPWDIYFQAEDWHLGKISWRQWVILGSKCSWENWNANVNITDLVIKQQTEPLKKRDEQVKGYTERR